MWIGLLAAGPFALDQIAPVQQFGREDLSGPEVESPYLHQDVEDAVGFAVLAGAEGTILLGVPTPGRVIVDVIWIRALDMRPSQAPRDTERVENIGFAAPDGGADRHGGDKAAAAVGRHGSPRR